VLKAIRGVYHDGIVELEETPPGVGRARVVVTFMETEAEAQEEEGGTAISLGNRFRAGAEGQDDPVPSALAELRNERSRRHSRFDPSE
jgi:hypothetical protein